MGYIANFIVYTLAMVGVIVFALFVFKNATAGSCRKTSKHLKVIDSMSLGPRKTLYVVSAGKEKFLIAGDVDKTSLISKLDWEENEITIHSAKEHKIDSQSTFKDTMNKLANHGYMDRTILGNTGLRKTEVNTINSSVMRNLAERMKK